MAQKIGIDLSILNWLKREIDENLTRARKALASHIEDPTGSDSIRHCVDQLHQVQGTLRMVELYGAALVAEEMESLAASMGAGEIEASEDNYTVLLRGMVQLPDYLERLQSGHRDIPVVLLPLLNELRASRGEQLISESVLFFPDLDEALAESDTSQLPAAEAGLGDKQIRRRARSIRTRFHRYLLAWFQGRDVDKALEMLVRTMDDMNHLTTAHDWRQLWWITSATFEGVAAGGGDTSNAGKVIMGRVDQCMRQIADQGESALSEPAPRPLMKNLLYLAGTGTQSPRVKDVRRRYKLGDLFPDRAEIEHAEGAMSGQNRQLLGTVSAGIKEDLLRVKEGLDLIVHGKGNVETDVHDMTQILHQVGDTLAVLGLGVPRKIVQDQESILSEIAGGKRESDESTLLRIASALLYVESSLEELIETLGAKRGVEFAAPAAVLNEDGSLKRSDIRRILDSLMGEAITNIQTVKQAIVEFINEPDGPSPIQQVPVVLEEVVGALRILDLDRSASLLHDIGIWIDDHIVDQGVVPDPEEMEHLADAISSVEYYLEGVRDNWPGREGVLEIADRALSRISRPVAADIAGAGVSRAPEPVSREARAPAAPAEPEIISALPAIDEELDDEIREIFFDEAEKEIEDIARLYPEWRADPDDLETLTILRRSFHTLKGSGRVVGARRLGEFCWKIEQMLNRVLEHAVPVTSSLFQTMDGALQVLPTLVADLRGTGSVGPELDVIVAAAERVTAGEIAPSGPEPEPGPAPATAEGVLQSPETLPDMDPALYEVFREEAQGHLEVLKLYLERCDQAGEPLAADDTTFRAVHTLNGAASMAQVSAIAAISTPLEAWFKRIREAGTAPTPEGLDTLRRVVESVNIIVMALAMPGSELPPTENLVARINVLAARLPGSEEEQIIEPAPAETEPKLPDPTPSFEMPAPAPETAEPELIALEADEELLEIFLQEGGEILDEADTITQRWRAAPSDNSIAAELQRELHTLKGGARMAGIEAVGDVSHAMESLCAAIGSGQILVNDDAFATIERGFDTLHDMLRQVETQRAVAERPVMIAEIEALRLGGRPAVAAPVPPSAQPAATPPPQAPAEPPPALEAAVEPPEPQAPVQPEPVVPPRPETDLTRIRTGLLDDMVNAAGEVNIFRSQLEQQMGSLRFNLDEFNQTVTRLSDQLRQLDKETETQILSRIDVDRPEGSEDFDPLEMDRYSHIQQLSRGLAETVDDLVSIQDMLDDLTRESESLLAQQSRVSADLQQGLMRTRMTRFDQLVPRLRRIVRQTSDELNRKVLLNVDGGEGELDRTVLDRVTASLEHILRNAVAHGIESPEERRAAGKDETGRIDLTVRREGSDVVINIQDDGAGIDTAQVRRMAVEKGLVDPNTALSDDAVLQLISGAGFSTAAELTQIAGRGVGLDVVNSEVRQLGGSLAVRSRKGEGARFTIRLPFTVAVAPALLVEAGRQTFAVPLSTVVGVVRLPVEAYRKLVEDHGGDFDYGGTVYPIYDLALLLSLAKRSHYPDDEQMSLIVVRSGEENAALRVDRLLGNREVVVKSVGTLLNQVPGVFGATILGDGRVILILDIAPLAEKGAEAGLDPSALIPIPPELAGDTDRRVRVLVVDDSITMRKVTGRVLERHNMKVYTAKDGVDAIAVMQDVVPDIMLLDIEMPRMDGFDLAAHMRTDERLREVPIIMVTSRSGAKHRQRAEDLGIESYIGKPYQEDALLTTIHELLEKNRVTV